MSKDNKEKKDWSGNSNSVYKTLGSSHHSDHDRETYDYYATEPKATKLLLKLETFSQQIWEPACGEGHMSKVLADAGYVVKSTDFIDRGFGTGDVDFLSIDNQEYGGGGYHYKPTLHLCKGVYFKSLINSTRRHQNCYVLKTAIYGR